MGISKKTVRLLSNGENLEVEYKANLDSNFNETLVAFANAKGGYCLFGVRDSKNQKGNQKGIIQGIEISDESKLKIQNRADETHDKIDIEISAEYDEKGRGIYVVYVKEGRNKPYCTANGRYLIRRNGKNTIITPTMMEDLVAPRIRKLSPAKKKLYFKELSRLKNTLHESIWNWERYIERGSLGFYADAEVEEVIESLTINDPELISLSKQFLQILQKVQKLHRQSSDEARRSYLSTALNEIDFHESGINFHQLESLCVKRMRNLFREISLRIDYLLN